jgi:hypothetical protein
MEQYLRDYHARRIIADIYPFEFNGKIYYITYPTAEFRFYAEKVYTETYQCAKDNNISTDYIIVLLDKYKIWNEEDESRLITYKKELEDTKVCLFENFFHENKRPAYKKVINDLRIAIDELTYRKQSMNHFTAEYSASSARQKFLIGASILRPNKKRLWTKISDWDKENKIIDVAFEHMASNYMGEYDIRDIVKHDPWKTIWSLQKRPQSIFRKSIGDFTEEQQSLSIWSIVYDNIAKSAEPLSDSVIMDDDALDGWMIIQRRKSETVSDKAEIAQQINSKVAQSGEIFVMADTPDQVKKIYEMNDFAGKIAFKKRMLQINRDKFVDEVNMIETRERMVMQANNAQSQMLRR